VAAFPGADRVKELAREMSDLAHDGQESPGTAEAIRSVLRRRLDDPPRERRRLSEVVVPLLPPGDLLVFTLSKSSTVQGVLTDLHDSGRRLAVLVAESRPGAEGARMARDLGEYGIRTRACDDFLLLSLVPKEAAPRRPPHYVGSPVVLVGADAVHPDGLVNKVGTRALLETAIRSGVPAFVLATTAKLRTDRAPTVLGSLFETVPRSSLTILTEEGPVGS
jgi:translation initiation factor 2B subunit (eIF-2B alpha/beta/delta family)